MPDESAKPLDAAKRKELESKYAKFVAEVWANEELRLRLLADPVAVLREFGFDIPQGKKVKIIEVDIEEDTLYFILPTKPDVLVELLLEPPCFYFHLCH
jgi:Nitrile hydratase, alpha chain